MSRVISLFLTVLFLLSALAGCNEMPAVNGNVKPGQHFSQYDTLTDLYGTPWREVLEKLDIDQQELDLEGLNCVGIPRQENYADITLNTALRFGGDENRLLGVEYTATYKYPEEEGELLRDLVMINRELISDFGNASDTSFVFNWAEKMLGEKWNRKIPYWQDVQVLKRLVDEGYEGRILYWNLTPVASAAVKKVHSNHGLSVNISILETEGLAVITINY